LGYAPDSNYVIVSKLYKGRNGVAVWTPISDIFDQSTLYTNTLFVSKAGGDNNTAERENINKPWGDIWAAKRAAQPGDLIYVRDGRWTVGADVIFPTNDADSTTILKDSITYFFAPATGINVDGNERIFYDTAGVNTTILGYMVFNGPNTNSNCMFAQAENSNIYIEFDSLNLGNGAGFNNFAHFRKFKSWNLNINNFNADRSESFYFGAAATDTILSGELSINIQNYRTVTDVCFGFFGSLGGYWENVNVSLNVKNANVDFEYYEVDINDVNTTWKNCNLSVHFDKCLISSVNHTGTGDFFRLSGGPYGPGSEGNQIKISGNYQLNNAVGFKLLTAINFDGAGDSLTYVIENLTCYSERYAFGLSSRSGSATENVILKNVRVGCLTEDAVRFTNNVNSQYYLQDCFFYTESDTSVFSINTDNVTIANSTFIRNINAPLTGGNVFAATAPHTVRTAGVYSNESVADADLTFTGITQHPSLSGNIYTSDGSITADRTVTGGSNNLTFTGMNNFTATGSGSATYQLNLYPSSSLPILLEQSIAGVDTAHLQLRANLGRATLRATQDIYFEAATAIYASTLEGSETGIISVRPNGEIIRREKAFCSLGTVTHSLTVALSDTELNNTWTTYVNENFNVSGDSVIYSGTDTAYFSISYFADIEFTETLTGSYRIDLKVSKNGAVMANSVSEHLVYYTAAETEPIQLAGKTFQTLMTPGDVFVIEQSGTTGAGVDLQNIVFNANKIQ